MKKLLLAITVLLMASFAVDAQKIAVVDTDYILENMSEYRISKEQLDELAVEWQKQIEAKFYEIDSLYKVFQAEAPVLPDEEKTKRENLIIAKEKEVKDLQKKRFGKEGDLFKKRQELVQPIQEKVYNAIKETADADNYAIILDKSGSISIPYVRDKYDISDDVLKKLGYEPGGFGSGN
ncbi:MAG: OmpH family outer membrane protein [Bacteroidales bacterium]|nr:OmpH family outer membrane protein [Bacteroidales bacterium]